MRAPARRLTYGEHWRAYERDELLGIRPIGPLAAACERGAALDIDSAAVCCRPGCAVLCSLAS